MRLKILLSASTFLLFAAGGAMAADVVEAPPPAPVAQVPVFTWTGPYIGIQGGYAWATANLSDPLGLGIESDEDFNGGLLGGFIGYNWQAGNNFVIGVEGDINALWNDQTFNISGLDVDIGSDYVASVRGRLGYAWDRALIFATGGVAFTSVSADASVNGIDLSSSADYTGWTIGAGVDYAFTDNWFGRLEYRYYDFSDQNILDTLRLNTGDVDVNYNTVTVGIAYKW